MSTNPGYDLTNDQDREDRRKHLELISNTVARMSGASANAKGWTITLATAAFGAGAIKDLWYLHLVGIGVVLVFLYLDVRYLITEKKFRDLYDLVLSNAIPPLSMDISNIPDQPRNKTYRSWSIRGLYGPLVLAGLLLMGFSVFTDGATASDEVRPHVPASVVISPQTTAPTPTPAGTPNPTRAAHPKPTGTP